MKSITSTEELKSIEFDILKYVKLICEKEKLNYFLAYGTLLGAVRHQGFIPWDDDIDIFMPRKDYECFLKLKNTSEYRVLSCNNSSDYFYEFAKVVDSRTSLVEKNVKNIPDLGVYIDVFPLDGLPRVYYWHVAILFLLTKVRIVMSLLKPLFFRRIFFLNPVYIAQKVNRLLCKYEWEESDKIISIEGGFNEVFKKEEFAKSVKLEFMGESFNAPWRYKSYLKQCYGDYMKLPPKEKQITHHFFDAYWKV